MPVRYRGIRAVQRIGEHSGVPGDTEALEDELDVGQLLPEVLVGARRGLSPSRRGDREGAGSTNLSAWS